MPSKPDSEETEEEEKVKTLDEKIDILDAKVQSIIDYFQRKEKQAKMMMEQQRAQQEAARMQKQGIVIQR